MTDDSTDDILNPNLEAAAPHPLQDELDAEVAYLAELQPNAFANSWHIERTEKRIAALSEVINGN